MDILPHAKGVLSDEVPLYRGIWTLSLQYHSRDSISALAWFHLLGGWELLL